MTTSNAALRPPIQMIDTEVDALTNLAIAAAERVPQASELLLDEIGRASVRKASDIAPDVVIMNALVTFVDEASGKTYHCRLVYPKDADISAGRISIMTPVGAGLIGLREGQSILWPNRNGHDRKLTIVQVTQRPAKS